MKTVLRNALNPGKLSLLILLFAFSLQACGDTTTTSADETGETEVTSSSENGLDNDFDFVEVGEYSTWVPDYMNSTTMLNDDASLQYQNLFKETYALVIDESKQEYIDIYRELDMYDESISALRNYTETQISFISEDVIVYNQTGPDAKQINGIDAEVVEITGKVGDVDVTYLIGFLEGQEKMYMIMTWTLPERYDKYKSDLETIINEFKLNETGSTSEGTSEEEVDAGEILESVEE